jgi:hypothetical protein
MKTSQLLAALLIPLGQAKDWQAVQFRNISANVNTFSESGLKIEVNSSASPLVLKLTNPFTTKKIRAKFKIEGALKNPTAKFPEDAFLRLGLVIPGLRRLNKMERLFAAGWILKLFELVPPEGGLSHIEFFDVVESSLKSFVNRSRVVPGSKDLMRETVSATSDQNSLVVELKDPTSVAAIWLGADGDNTKSKFFTELKELCLEP